MLTVVFLKKQTITKIEPGHFMDLHNAGKSVYLFNDLSSGYSKS